MKFYVVTNYGGGENYTPSITKTESDARKWMYECAASNIICAYTDKCAEIIRKKRDYDNEYEYHKALCEFAEDQGLPVEVYDKKIVIGDPDDGGNILQLFEENID